MRVLIDADPIVYACGFATEVVDYYVLWHDVLDPKDPYSDTPHQAGPFRGAWRRDAWMEWMGLTKDETEIIKDQIAEPIANCLHVVKQQVKNIEKAISGFLAESTDKVDSLELYLTDGKSNFRNEIATIKGYKANRDPSHKPVHYQKIRDYLVERWGARIMYGYEADDAVAIEQKQADEHTTVICTIDKDLKMVPGLHYNYQTKQESIVSDEEGLDFFYMQILTGDTTDNIGGCYRIGKVKAGKIISHALKDFNGNYAERSQRLYEAVHEAYILSDEAYGREAYNGLRATEALLENARLLWMQDYPGQLWTPPGQKDEVLDGYVK